MRATARLTLLLATAAAPASAHDLSQHDDLPYLAADCAGYWQGVADAAPGDDGMAAELAELYLAAARDLAPALAPDITYIARTSRIRARQMLKDAAQITAAERQLREQEQFCQSVGLALPAKWGFH
ncbi:hypothetical protein [Oceanicola sp. 502str15]|uniref:hypothetical protein n=1 Tax=Oceanicola sp. 502str15 TaxID=2696061 RepID=UPI0020950CDA|nr:hypothetical protein [Oceanicola sp. 502str15]MCO6382553.1 hypothetical protein [Oceanicola sp. 502str15]